MDHCPAAGSWDFESVRPSVTLFSHNQFFEILCWSVFEIFRDKLENHMAQKWPSPIFWENIFPKNGYKMFLENVVIKFCWKLSNMKDITDQNALIQSDCKIIWSSTSLEEINGYDRFNAWRYLVTERQRLRLLILVECSQVCPTMSKHP